MRHQIHLVPLLVAVAVGLFTWFVGHARLKRQQAAPGGSVAQGFAGWLRFLAAMQWLAVLHALADVGITLGHRNLAEVGSFSPYGKSGYILAIVVQAILFLFVLWVAIVMHRKSRLFPTLFRIEMVLLMLFPILVALLVTWEIEHGQMSPAVSIAYWVRVAVFAPAAGIGYVYSLRSIRFRNTFIR